VSKKIAQISGGELKKGDRVISLNGESTPFFEDFHNASALHKNESIDLGLLRGNDTVHVQAKLDSLGHVGFAADPDPEHFMTFVTRKYGFFESFPAGVRKSVEVMTDYISQLKILFTNKHVKTQDNVGSLISIGRVYAPVWDWESLWKLTAFLSVILGFMNILPIPALDGGHILFLLVEIVTGRKPGDKFLEYAQIGGMILLLGLMAYALGLDVFRLFKHH
jgi:regulator of sigma E protease